MTDPTPRPWSSGHVVVTVAAIVVGAVVILDLATAIPLLADGPIGLIQLFAVHLSLLTLVLLPLAVRRDARWLTPPTW